MAKLLYGAPQRKGVIKQIETRQNTFGTPDKSARQLEAIHQSTPWVVMRSSINILTDEEADSIITKPENRKSVKGTAKNAENNQLSGGILRGQNGSAPLGVQAKPTDEFNNPVYRTDKEFGTVPMPGITSVDVKSRGEYGSIKEAEVRLEIHSLRDLEEFERLYFRPGYTVLLEWGHSIYLDNSGNTVYAHRATHTISDDKWFSHMEEPTVLSEIDRLREETNFNYDAIYGIIRNFQWRFNAEGQKYEATVTVIGKGVLYEGIRIGSTLDNIPEDEIKAKDTENSGDQYKTAFHYLIFKLDEGRKKLQDRYDAYGQASTKELLQAANANTYAQNLEDYQFFYMQKPNQEDKLNYMGYIPLKLIFDVANNFNTIYAGEASKLPLVQFELDGQTFKTHNNHFSLDPGIAVPPQIAKDGLLRPLSVWFPGHIAANAPYIHEDMETWALNNGGVNLIGNIMVNTSYVIEVFDSILQESQESQKGLIEAIGNLLSGIQEALGGINNLAMFYNESVNEWICLDTNATKAKGDLLTLEVSGLKSTVNAVNIESSIKPEMSSMISIAAQGSRANTAENLSALLKWNKGAVDRHLPYRDVAKEDSNTSIKSVRERQGVYAEEIKGEWKKFNATYKDSSKRYDRDDWRTLRIEGLKQLHYAQHLQEIKDGTLPEGVIPVSLSFDMLGIGGFQIATAFKIREGILPSKYNPFGYLVTSENHSISLEGWTTSISANFFVLEEYSKLSKEDQELLLSEEETITDEEAARDVVAEDLESPNADALRNVLAELGYTEKQLVKGFLGLGGRYGELTSGGGDISYALYFAADNMFRSIKSRFPQYSLRVTAGNDAYHKGLNYQSAHTRGNGLDFVVLIGGRKAVEQIGDFLENYFATDTSVKFGNEYTGTSSGKKGNHFHIEV